MSNPLKVYIWSLKQTGRPSVIIEAIAESVDDAREQAEMQVSEFEQEYGFMQWVYPLLENKPDTIDNADRMTYIHVYGDHLVQISGRKRSQVKVAPKVKSVD